MKHLLLLVIALLVVSMAVEAQKQPLPTMSGGTQGLRSSMLKGPHDFTPDSGKYPISIVGVDTTWHPHGAARGLCGYCHAAHVPVTGIAQPLWIRASVVGVKNFGAPYTNPNSMDVAAEPIENSDNYSSFCMSCHDGSALFTASAYTEGRRPFAGSTSWAPYEGFTVPDAANIMDGEFNLEHVHPVNFDYAAAVSLDPAGLYSAQTATYVWSGPNSTAPGAPTTSVRLFDGYMQCSSCHNPHMNSGIGLVYSSAYGKLCVSCHKK